jgi:hypothetical protein
METEKKLWPIPKSSCLIKGKSLFSQFFKTNALLDFFLYWTENCHLTSFIRANLCENYNRIDYYIICWMIWYYQFCQSKISRKRRYSTRTTKINIRRKAIRRRKYFIWLQYPKRIRTTFNFKTKRWHANICLDIDWKNHQFGSQKFRYNWCCIS